MKSIAVIFFVAACSVSGAAQNMVTSNLNWTGTHSIDLQTGVEIEAPTNIISLTNLAIEFTRAGSTIHFDVVSSDGVWSNVQEEGSIVYHVVFQNMEGTVVFARVDGIASVIINWMKNQSQEFKQKVIIENITPIQ